ncbi:CvpA family protein [Sphingomonas antarctica]|uniref:CvpA family protein n=1 Tax=Sphingomonas antarctica TaxID=2040274 RepID=UPI0039E7C50A
MTGLDILVLTLVAIGALLGFRRGFVAEALSLVAWAAAIAAVKFGHGAATDVLHGFMSSDSGASVLALVLLFAVTFIAVKILAQRLGDRTRRSILGPFDRMLGLGFGVLKGLLGATLIFMAAAFASDMIRAEGQPRPEWMTEARTYPLLRAGSDAIVNLVEKRRKVPETRVQS